MSRYEKEKDVSYDTFVKYDANSDGLLNRVELRDAMEAVTGSKFSMSHIETLWAEFDKDQDGTIDYPEFQKMMGYVKSPTGDSTRRSTLLSDIANSFGASISSLDEIDEEELENKLDALFASKTVANVVKKSQKDYRELLKTIAQDLHQVKDLICVQDDVLENPLRENVRQHSVQLDLNELIGRDEKIDEDISTIDPDFEAAFSPSDMRCLALVSHNGMKKTMREFVVTNRNILKKFRLTGTNSTMTMLKEVFKDERPGTVVFGPSCASGPLGGDAELVAHLVEGKIGGIFFFQDPMDSHPHRADIDCLCRQALVHNTMMVQTPTSALMMLQTLRTALKGKGKPNLIPSFFFSLQSPTVEAYKKNQKKVVNSHKKEEHKRLASSRESMEYKPNH